MDTIKKVPTTDFPTFCRICNGPLDFMPYSNNKDAWDDAEGRPCKVIGYDIYNGTPRTLEYDVVCRNDPSHTKLKVVDTPSTGFRCVIRADRYDESRVRK